MIQMKMKKSALAIALALAVISPAAFSQSSAAATSATPKPSATNPYGAGAIDPAGPNEAILVITSSTKTMKFTLKQLMALKPTKISLFEPFVNKRQTFSVISLSSLFKKAGIKSWEKVVTKALNNYEYVNTASEFTSAKGYLAVKRNGVSIPYDQGGPIRLVYPDSSKWSKSLDPWNWSLASIYVQK
jgi:hypothetical protein